MMSDTLGGLAAFSLPVQVIMIGAAFLGGLVRGFAGFGAGMVIIPAYAACVGPATTVPLVQVMDAPGQIPLLLNTWRHIRWRELLPMLVASLVTTPLGVLCLKIMPATPLRLAFGTIVIVTAIALARGWKYQGDAGIGARAGIGAFAGFLSGATALSGPPIILFALALSNTATRARALITGYFLIQTAISVTMLAIAGLFTLPILGLGIVLCIPYILGIATGVLLFPLATQRFYRQLALVIVITIAVASLLDGLGAL